MLASALCVCVVVVAPYFPPPIFSGMLSSFAFLSFYALLLQWKVYRGLPDKCDSRRPRRVQRLLPNSRGSHHGNFFVILLPQNKSRLRITLEHKGISACPLFSLAHVLSCVLSLSSCGSLAAGLGPLFCGHGSGRFLRQRRGGSGRLAAWARRRRLERRCRLTTGADANGMPCALRFRPRAPYMTLQNETAAPAQPT